MTATSQYTRLRRILVPGIAVGALLAGALGGAPAMADTAGDGSTYTITGKVTVAGHPTVRLGAPGTITVYTNTCRKLPKYSPVWNGSAYSIEVMKPGRYRLVYGVGPDQHAAARYGATSAGCKKTTPVLVKAGTAARKNLAATPKGLVQVSGVRVGSPLGEYEDRESMAWPVLRFYDAHTGKRVKTVWSPDANIAPGTYKLTRWAYSSKKRAYVMTNVFGTRTKSIARGKTITVVKNRALGANFDTGKARRLKEFPGTHSISVSGTPQLGSTLTSSISGAFPSGTRISYQWWRYYWDQYDEVDFFSPATGKIESWITLDGPIKLDDSVWIDVTAKKSGYVTRSWRSTSVHVTAAP